MKYDLSDKLDQQKALLRFEYLCKKKAKIEIKRFHARRSLQQNAYFHVCCGILSEYSGYTVDEVKIIIKDQLEFMTYTKNGHKFYRSSADLDKMDFTALVEYTRDFALNHGCYIPTPEDYMEAQFEIEKELRL